MLTDAFPQEEKTVDLTLPQPVSAKSVAHPKGWATRCLQDWLNEMRRGASETDREAALDGQKQVDPLATMT